MKNHAQILLLLFYTEDLGVLGNFTEVKAFREHFSPRPYPDQTVPIKTVYASCKYCTLLLSFHYNILGV